MGFSFTWFLAFSFSYNKQFFNNFVLLFCFSFWDSLALFFFFVLCFRLLFHSPCFFCYCLRFSFGYFLFYSPCFFCTACAALWLTVSLIGFCCRLHRNETRRNIIELEFDTTLARLLLSVWNKITSCFLPSLFSSNYCLIRLVFISFSFVSCPLTRLVRAV